VKLKKIAIYCHVFVFIVGIQIVFRTIKLKQIEPMLEFKHFERKAFIFRELNEIQASRIIKRLSTFIFKKNLCIIQSITLKHMLNKMSIESKICLGLKKESDNLIAHAWVEIQNMPLFFLDKKQFEFTKVKEIS
jgi:hypothetical protein